ncbi:MAG: hypothetical protein ACR2NO_06090 [Chloroflexota bacterium]
MGKKYEDEIREILKGLDDGPGERRGAHDSETTPSRARSGGLGVGPRQRSLGRFSGLSINPQRVMGFALILILFAWVMQGPWARGFPDVFRLAGYISLAGTIMFVVALIALLRAGGRLGGGIADGSRAQRWRGQVIYLPNRQPFWVRWRQALARLIRRPR